jgi:predicted dienelactone hydrolase
MSTSRTLATLALLVTLAACGGDDSGSAGEDVPQTAPATAGTEPAATADTDVTNTEAAEATTTTTIEPAPLELFTERGPYAVGVVTLEVGDRLAEVWYPVDADTVAGQPTEIFDSLSVFPESLQPLIPEELSGLVDTGAVRDAPAARDDGPFPVVAYSHGFGGFRQTFTAYTTHLASWGFVVTSTDHLERGIAAQATGQVQRIPGKDVADITDTLDALAASDLADIADLDNVAITGHSAGAGTAARSAAELDVVDSFISISGSLPVTVTGDDIGAPAARLVGTTDSHEVQVISVSETDAEIVVDGGDPQTVPLDSLTVVAREGSLTLVVADGELVPGTVTVSPMVAAKPALVAMGELDAVVVPEASDALYAALSSPKWLVNIENAGHNSFTDSCPGIRELGGLGSLTPLLGEAQVARADDGCLADNVAPELSWRVLGHYSVAFLRSTLGVEDSTASIAVDVTDEIDGVSLADFQVES